MKRLYLALLLSLMVFVAFAKQKRPNVIIFITDDQHRSELNYLPEAVDEQGKHRNFTPTLDRLAKEGIVFEQQHVVAGICTPSRYSILTGHYPSRATNQDFAQEYGRLQQRNPHFNVGITDQNITIAKLFQAAGYFTGGVGKNHVIEGKGKTLHGMKNGASREETLQHLKHIQDENIAAYKACGFDFAKNIYPGNLPGFLPDYLMFHNTDWIIQGAHDFLNEASSKERPFFLYCATTVSHGPHKLGSKYDGDRRATAAGLLEKPVKVMPDISSIEARIKAKGLADEAKDALWLDDAINSLIVKLEAMDELDNTIIFFMTDNAVESGKFTCYEGGTRTPSIYWGPGFFRGGRKTSAYASNLDILPTLADLCGIKLPADYQADGKSLVPILKGRKKDVHEAIFLEVGSTKAILKDGWKYIAFRVPEKQYKMSLENRKKLVREGVDYDAAFTHIGDRPGGRGGERPAMAHYPAYYDKDQLYNLRRDPDEQDNLANKPEFKEKLDALKHEMKQHLQSIPGPFGELKQN